MNEGKRSKNKNGIVCEHGINDMPRGWYSESEWNKIVYEKWCSMLSRVYSEKNTHPKYLQATIQLEFHWLSYFVDNIKKIDGYDEEKFIKKELSLDKDIKSNGKNKEYSIKNCLFVSSSENTKQSNETMSYEHMMGKNNPRARCVEQRTLNGDLIKVWDCIILASKELNICKSSIKNCCTGRYKSAGNFKWNYVDRK